MPADNSLEADRALQGSCHCGAVRLTLPSAPEKATSCNCSLCRRSGAIFGYYEFGTVSVQGHPENTQEYIWGDRTLKRKQPSWRLTEATPFRSSSTY